MKRVATIKAYDGRTKLTIRAEIHTEDLTKDETAEVISQTIRGMADGIRGIKYTDFGPDNIQVQR